MKSHTVKDRGRAHRRPHDVTGGGLRRGLSSAIINLTEGSTSRRKREIGRLGLFRDRYELDGLLPALCASQ